MSNSERMRSGDKSIFLTSSLGYTYVPFKQTARKSGQQVSLSSQPMSQLHRPLRCLSLRIIPLPENSKQCPSQDCISKIDSSKSVDRQKNILMFYLKANYRYLSEYNY